MAENSSNKMQDAKDLLARQVYEKMMSTDYCSQWMGIKAITVKEGYCKLSMVIKREMLNGYGILHGGIAYAFADSAFAFASNSYGRIAVSITGNMHFHKSASEGMTLFAEAEMIHLTHKTGDFKVDLKDEEDELYYSFRGVVYRKSQEVLNA